MKNITCTTTHHRDLLWNIISHLDDECGRREAQKKLLMDAQTIDGQMTRSKYNTTLLVYKTEVSTDFLLLKH